MNELKAIFMKFYVSVMNKVVKIFYIKYGIAYTLNYDLKFMYS